MPGENKNELHSLIIVDSKLAEKIYQSYIIKGKAEISFNQLSFMYVREIHDLSRIVR